MHVAYWLLTARAVGLLIVHMTGNFQGFLDLLDAVLRDAGSYQTIFMDHDFVKVQFKV